MILSVKSISFFLLVTLGLEIMILVKSGNFESIYLHKSMFIKVGINSYMKVHSAMTHTWFQLMATEGKEDRSVREDVGSLKGLKSTSTNGQFDEGINTSVLNQVRITQ